MKTERKVSRNFAAVNDGKIVDALIMEYKEWLSRQRYWARLFFQSATILLAISGLSATFLDLGSNTSSQLVLGIFVIFAVVVGISAWIYLYFRKISIKRLREIEETLDGFGIHLGYQRSFDKVPIPKYRREVGD